MGTPIIPLTDRFWHFVNKGGPVPAHTPNIGPCWVWTGNCTVGYGMIKIERRQRHAHRISWELHNGNIPDGLWVLHRCDNPPCVNPAHLFLGTAADNARDRVRKGRGNSPVGIRNYHHKLDDDEIRKIRKMLVSGICQSEIAKIFGVTQSNVSHIATKKSWNHVP